MSPRVPNVKTMAAIQSPFSSAVESNVSMRRVRPDVAGRDWQGLRGQESHSNKTAQEVKCICANTDQPNNRLSAMTSVGSPAVATEAMQQKRAQ